MLASNSTVQTSYAFSSQHGLGTIVTTITAVTNNWTNFTMNNNGTITDAQLTVTGAPVHNLYINNILTDGNIQQLYYNSATSGSSLLTLNTARTVSIDFTGSVVANPQIPQPNTGGGGSGPSFPPVSPPPTNNSTCPYGVYPTGVCVPAPTNAQYNSTTPTLHLFIEPTLLHIPSGDINTHQFTIDWDGPKQIFVTNIIANSSQIPVTFDHIPIQVNAGNCISFRNCATLNFVSTVGINLNPDLYTIQVSITATSGPITEIASGSIQIDTRPDNTGLYLILGGLGALGITILVAHGIMRKKKNKSEKLKDHQPILKQDKKLQDKTLPKASKEEKNMGKKLKKGIKKIDKERR